MTLERAMEVAAKGFCFTRSYTHPYVPEKDGTAWFLHDEPYRPLDGRKAEWFAHGIQPGELIRLALNTSHHRFTLCVFRKPEELFDPIKRAFKDSGCRYWGREGIFVRGLGGPTVELSKADGVDIDRVLDLDFAGRLAKAAGSRQILPHHLKEANPSIRQYAASSGEKLVGWVRSITVCDATWCSNLYVDPEFRRRGIASALMTRMLADDQAAGLTANVLAASTVGAKLYPTLGYEWIGELLIFKPSRTRPKALGVRGFAAL